MTETLHSQSREPGFSPWSGNMIPCATTMIQCSQINKYFKMHNIYVNRNGQRTLRKYTDGQQARGKLLRHHYSVQFSHSVVSDSLQPHESQHARPPCPSPTPGVHSNSCPLSWRCHPAISSSVVPFSSCPQSFPASESFPMSQLFA